MGNGARRGGGPTLRRAVFLDRDGVINRSIVRGGKPYPPASLDEFELLPGVAEAIAALRAAGFLVIVATNQPDVAKGTQRREVVEAMHARLRKELAVDDVRVCYHQDKDGCACRKPRPGMLEDAARAWSIALAESYMVGDRWRDIAAGRAAGCRTAFIDCGYDEQAPEAPDVVVDSLAAACRWILARERSSAASEGFPGERQISG
ncbi:MAG: D-glycero-alpha-D-manno-heptose-1,7-bisphosphate 7-phosphatase [Alphaproteobacteria bacterium]